MQLLSVQNKRFKILFWSVSFLFIALNALAITNNNYFVALAPLSLILIYLFIFRLDLLFDILVFATPLSVQLSEFFPSLGLDLFLPTEPVIFTFMLVIGFKFLLGATFDKKFIRHPVTITIIIYLLWLFITSVTSTMPIVSFKYLLVKLWYITVFYFFISKHISHSKQVHKFLWLYTIPLSFVIVYTLYRLSGFGLNNFKAAHFVMSPFYRDHTIYGALLAFYIPPVIGLFFSKIKFFKKIVLLFIILLLFLGLIYSYTRAAWLSLIGSLAVFLILKFKIKFRYLLLGFLAILILGFQLWWSVYFRLKDNKQDSSSNFTEHIESMSNIATDASNLERINRWKSAIRLFQEKPLTGWGPGTYQFQYAQYQFSYDKTIISTDFGDGGNAHSEYLGLLSETGLPGMLIFILLIILTIRTAVKAYKKNENKQDKMMILSLLLGLISYFLHAFLNNYLDTDKASVPFWGFMAIIVLYDLKISDKYI